jgi:protein deglycase
MPSKIVIFLANGFEEIEAVTPIDIFRRIELPAVLCAVTRDGSREVTSSRGITIKCDALPEELDPADFMLTYFPGGMPGATNLAADIRVTDFAREVYDNGGYCAAICAAPLALDAAGLIAPDTEYTCYPGIEKHIDSGHYTGKFTQQSGHIITACGPAASIPFVLEILRNIGYAQEADNLGDAMLI